MALSKHPNVLKVYGSFVNGSKLYIATPYLSGGIEKIYDWFYIYSHTIIL